MKEIIKELIAWRDAGKRFATATVVAVEGSGPREPGAMMAVSENGEVAGSVSGGCVEGAVVEDALCRMGAPDAVLSNFGLLGKGDADPSAATLSFGYSDDEALAVGLTCGGTFHILVQPDPPQFLDEIAEAISESRPFAIATVYGVAEEQGGYFDQENRDTPLPAVGASLLVRESGESSGSLGSADLDRVVVRDALGAIRQARGTRRTYGRRGQSRSREVSVVFSVQAQPPNMYIFGAVDFSEALSRAAKLLGYRVTVVDARPVFATRERFPAADQVVVAWPNAFLEGSRSLIAERDALCILTHDPKFDVPAIVAALDTSAGYVGIMGSRRTQEDRLLRLEKLGYSAEQIQKRVSGPIGLDIGARTPEETAISILAEVIAKREGKVAGPLSETAGPIHVDGAMTW